MGRNCWKIWRWSLKVRIDRGELGGGGKEGGGGGGGGGGGERGDVHLKISYPLN